MENAELVILDCDRRYFPTTNKILAKAYKFAEDNYLKAVYSFFIFPSLKKKLKILGEERIKIIAADKETEALLKKRGISFLSPRDYISEKEFLEQEKKSLSFIREVPRIAPELDIRHKGLALWRFDEYIMFEKFFPPLLQNIETISRIIEQEKPKKVVVYNSSSKWGMIQKKFSSKLEIEDKTDILSSLRKKIFEMLTPLAVRTLDFSFMEPKREDNLPHQKIVMQQNERKQQKNKEIVFFESERMFQCYHNLLKRLKPRATILQDEEYKQKSEEFPFESIHDYVSSKAKNELGQLQRSLVKKLAMLKNSSEFRRKLQYKEIPLFDMLRDVWDYVFVMGFIKSAYYVECIGSYLATNQPRLVIIMCEDPKRQKVTAELAKKMGIKTLMLMHGAIGERDILYNKLLSGHIATYGKHYAGIFVKLDYPTEQITITGNPAWDNILDIKMSRKDLYTRLGLSEDKRIILLATTHFPIDVRDGMAYASFKAMKLLSPDSSKYRLVIKVHPEESPNFYLALAEEFGIKIKVIEELSLLHPLIAHSELVIISDSTVGLETILLNRPLIDINLSQAPFWNDYVEKGAALGVKKEEELLPAINSILGDKKIKSLLEKSRKKYVYSHLYRQDGKAAERVAKLVEKLVK